MIPSALISAALIFGMFGATSVAGVAVFGVFYGFFSGGVGGLNILDSKIHQSPQWYQLLHLRYGLL